MEPSRTLKDLYEKRHASDILLGVKNEEGVIKAHRFVLTAASKYFKTLLPAMPEKTMFCVGDEGDLTFEALQRIIKYIYTGEVNVKSFDQLQELYKAGEFLGLADMCKVFDENVQEFLDMDNIFSVICCADAFLEACNNAAIYLFLDKNMTKILSHQCFLSLPFDIIVWLLDVDIIHLDECEMFNAAVKWMNHDFANRHDKFSKLLKSGLYYQEGGKISIDFIMNEVLRLCNCEKSKRFLIHYMALMQGYVDGGPVRVIDRW